MRSAEAEDLMILRMGAFLRETSGLHPLWVGAYMLALLHQLGTGPLPADVAECARIMRLPRDEDGVVKAVLHRFFSEQPDRTWLNPKYEGLRRDWLKHIARLKNRAEAANEARWKTHEAEARNNPYGLHKDIHKDSIGIAQGHPQGLLVVQVPEIPNLSSNKLEGRMTRRRVHTGNADQLSPNPSPVPGPSEPPPASPAASIEAKTKRKPQNRPVDAPEQARKHNGSTGGEKAAGRPKPSRNSPGKKALSDPPKPKKTPDPRFGPFRKEFFAFWRANHPDGLNHAWGREDGNALNRLLRANPHLGLDGYKRLLVSRARSDADLVNLSLAPASWMHRLTEFADGPWKARKKAGAPST